MGSEVNVKTLNQEQFLYFCAKFKVYLEIVNWKIQQNIQKKSTLTYNLLKQTLGIISYTWCRAQWT